MSDIDGDIELDLSGGVIIVPQKPEDCESVRTIELNADPSIASEHIATKSKPIRKLLGLGFRRPVQDEKKEDIIPEEIIAGPPSTIEEHENLQGLDESPDSLDAKAELQEQPAIVSPPSSPPRSVAMSPARSILSLFQQEAPSKTRSYVYQEDLLALDSDSDDERSMVEAQNAEQLLGSAMRVAEDGTGENFLSLSRAPRDDATELGQRVLTLPDDKKRAIGLSPTLLSDDNDDASIQSWASQATETTFIKVEKKERGSYSQEYWGGIVASMSLDAEDGASRGPIFHSPQDDFDHDPSDIVPPEAKSPPRKEKPVPAAVLAPPANRKWDKLRNTIEAQEKEAPVGYEEETGKFKKSRSIRVPKIGKGIRKSFDGLRQVMSQDEGETAPKRKTKKTVVSIPRAKSTDEGDLDRSSFLRSLRQVKSIDDADNFSLSLGPPPSMREVEDSVPQIVDGPSNVRISVEDHSKAELAKMSAEALEKSMDATVSSRDTDPESSIEESMEVLYLGDRKSWLGGKGHFKTEIQG